MNGKVEVDQGYTIKEIKDGIVNVLRNGASKSLVEIAAIIFFDQSWIEKNRKCLCDRLIYAVQTSNNPHDIEEAGRLLFNNDRLYYSDGYYWFYGEEYEDY